MRSNQTRLVILLCVLAGIKVLIFSAAFPFFNNVDEGAHYDMTCKYASGHIPRHIEHYSAESAAMIAMFCSPEYYSQWDDFTELQPVWTLPAEEVAGPLQDAEISYRQNTNHDSTQAPVYYLAAGGWYRIGKALGLRGGNLLYWLRFLNVPIYMLLVWIAYLMTTKLYPGNRFLILGVPAMLVFFPQDVFYGLNSDVLSALLATLSLYMLLTYYLEQRSARFCILAGLSVAAAFLTKVTNDPLLVFFGIILVAKAVRLRQKNGPGGQVLGLISALLAAAVPIGVWALRNYLVMGDASAVHEKLRRLTWTVKPIGEILHHPIFSPRGAIVFWSDLLRTFWRGEIVWHTVRIASGYADAVYILTSTAFLIAALVWAFRRGSKSRFADLANLGLFGLSVAFLAILSVRYDFGQCGYPSRSYPFFTSGRLILGALVPFLMLYLSGLEVILSRARLSSMRWIALALILLITIGSEIHISGGVFASAYNFFHMLSD